MAAAFMSPVGRLVVLRSVPRQRIIEAIAMITWPGLIGPVLGPPLGGWIAAHDDLELPGILPLLKLPNYRRHSNSAHRWSRGRLWSSSQDDDLSGHHIPEGLCVQDDQNNFSRSPFCVVPSNTS
jgi:hypothetical protein